MSDRRDYFFRQLVTESEIDQGFDGLEVADRDIVKDIGLIGITTATVSENTPTPDLSVNVEDLLSFDKDGQRVTAAGINNIDASVDFTATSTAVGTPGNEKILTVFIEFDRSLSDPRLDGNNDTVFFVRNETFTLIVKQGAESLSPATPVAAEADKLIVADITLVFGQTQIFDADIDVTRQEKLISTNTDIPIGDTFREAITDLANFTDALISMGLNEKYRRQSTKATGHTLDTPGDGATFTRDGKAITAELPNSVNWSTTRNHDPFLASYRSEFDDYNDTATAASPSFGGDVALVVLNSRRFTNDGNERTAKGEMLGTSVSYIARDIRSATLNGDTVHTYISKTAAATLNPGGGVPTQIQLDSPHYFRAGGVTSLRVSSVDSDEVTMGSDILLVTHGDGTLQAYTISSIVADDIVTVQLLGAAATVDAAQLPVTTGNDPAFPVNETVTVQWFSLSSLVGNAAQGQVYCTPAVLTNAATTVKGTGYTSTGKGRAFQILKVDTATGLLSTKLVIEGDSTIDSYEGATAPNTGTIRHTFTHRAGPFSTASGNFQIDVDPINTAEAEGTGQGNSLLAFTSSAAPAASQTITINAVVTNNEGAVLHFVFDNPGEANITMVWPANYDFETPADAQMSAINTHVGGGKIHWTGIAVFGRVLMTKKEYWD